MIITTWTESRHWFRNTWQRLTRGYADVDIWNLDTTIAKFVLPRLRAFRNGGVCAYPDAYPEGLTMAEWNNLLGEMIYAFEYYADDDRLCATGDADELSRIQGGLAAFAVYYGSLWD